MVIVTLLNKCSSDHVYSLYTEEKDVTNFNCMPDMWSMETTPLEIEH